MSGLTIEIARSIKKCCNDIMNCTSVGEAHAMKVFFTDSIKCLYEDEVISLQYFNYIKRKYNCAFRTVESEIEDNCVSTYKFKRCLR